jgi:hypothetical protein
VITIHAIIMEVVVIVIESVSSIIMDFHVIILVRVIGIEQWVRVAHVISPQEWLRNRKNKSKQ